MARARELEVGEEEEGAEQPYVWKIVTSSLAFVLPAVFLGPQLTMKRRADA